MLVVSSVVGVIVGVPAVVSLRENEIATLTDTMNSPLVTMIVGALLGFAVGQQHKGAGPR